MKILHIIPAYFPAHRYGGPIQSVHELNKGLVKLGIDVTVYTTNIDGGGVVNMPTKKECVLDGVKVFYFPITWRPWVYSLSLQGAVKRNIKNFDIIHITSVFLSVSTLGAYYARKHEIPYIISPRGSLMKEPLKGKNILKTLKKKLYITMIEKRNMEQASAIHFTVRNEEPEYKANKLQYKKSFIIQNGIALNKEKEEVAKGVFRKKYNIADSEKIVLFLGRLHWIKGLDTLIPAFADVIKRGKGGYLVLVGGDDEGYREKLEEWIKEYNIGNKVVFTGMLLGKDKIAAIRDSAILVLPSYSESFGMAAVEAMDMGIPVILTKNVGIASDVERVGAGLVVEKKIDQLARAIIKIMGNERLAREMGSRGRLLVREEFSITKVAERFIKEYTDLINQS